MRPTIESVWFGLTGSPVEETLLEWPPDSFAFTGTMLERSQAYRFAVSPPAGRQWPPTRRAEWSDAISDAAAQWCGWAEEREGPPPSLVARSWAVVRNSVTTKLDDVGSGHAWPLCESLLTSHAVSDEACAGIGVAVDLSRTSGYRCRARARELLARTGSLSRLPRHRLRVLPKGRTPDGGISFRSLSRYVCLRGPAVEVAWDRAPVRRPGDVHQQANVLLLPWPLRIRQRDFRPVRKSVQRIEHEPFGFFEFEPGEPLDFGLLDRVLMSARDEAGKVDVVVLPESSVRSGDLEKLEATLVRHRVAMLVAGIREDAAASGEPPHNWVCVGVYLGDRWWRYRQNKHHRWFLNRKQIDQYDLAGALHPSVRWWEAMSVPQRSVQFIELSEGITFVAVICEDLARLDEVADLLRAVGPTMVVTPLLDGPQLPSRWTARYASVFADDPGSAVLTLAPYGLVERSRPAGAAPSSVVALWKDSTGGLREITLDPGSQGVLLSVVVDCARRRSADGRAPVDNAADLFVSGVRQIRAVQAPPSRRRDAVSTTGLPPTSGLHTTELTIVASWAEAVAEAIKASPRHVEAVVADALSGTGWRAEFGIEEPSAALRGALIALGDVVEVGSANPDGPTMEQMRQELNRTDRTSDAVALLARKVMQSALESNLACGPT